MTYLDALPPYALSLAAAVFLLLAGWRAWENNIKTATFFGGLFLLCTLLVYFPQLDSINAIGVNVKLRKNLDRAQDILDQLKQLAVINAKSSYSQMAWGNRMGNSPATERADMFDAINDQLIALKLSEADRRELAQPIVEFIGVDLYVIYKNVFTRWLFWKEHDIAHRNGTDGKLVQAFHDGRSDWLRASARGPGDELKYYDLESFLRKATPAQMLDANERVIADRFISEILSLYNGCRKKGGYTHDAALYLDKYDNISGADRKVRELFGVEPSAIP